MPPIGGIGNAFASLWMTPESLDRGAGTAWHTSARHDNWTGGLLSNRLAMPNRELQRSSASGRAATAHFPITIVET
jgi:hypothetical protein